jgi:zinc-binding alcohol dehydrogenase/oxidoreductase
MGTDDELSAMVAFFGRERLLPVVDRVFPLAEAQEALRLMDEAGQFGKIVVET